MKYDIFISYRREGGYDTAKHLNDLLVRDGYKVSFDIDTLRSGDFDTQLLERIDQCKDFVLIIDQHAFDRTLDPNFNPKNDWMRCELAYALKKNKNIIPVFLSGVTQFPANLPEDIAGVIKKNGPEYNRYYFNDFYKTLKSRFLHKKVNYKLIISALLSLIVLATISFLLYNSYGHTEKKDATENITSLEEQTDSYETESQKDITTYEIELLTVINTFVQAYEQGEYHNIYWDVFAQKPLTPLSRSSGMVPEGLHYPKVLELKGKLLYNGKPLTTYDTGQAADWIVSLHGSDAGPTMLRIGPDAEGAFGDDELALTAKSVVQKAGFVFVREKSANYVDISYLYKKGDLFCLICETCGSAGYSIDMIITADKKEIDSYDIDSQ